MTQKKLELKEVHPKYAAQQKVVEEARLKLLNQVNSDEEYKGEIVTTQRDGGENDPVYAQKNQYIKPDVSPNKSIAGIDQYSELTVEKLKNIVNDAMASIDNKKEMVVYVITPEGLVDIRETKEFNAAVIEELSKQIKESKDGK